MIHYTQGSISVEQQNQEMFFEIHHPEKWSFAKISIINSNDGKENTITTTPNKKASFEIHENSEYWIDAKIRVNGNSSSAYNVIEINSIPENHVRKRYHCNSRKTDQHNSNNINRNSNIWSN